MRRVLCIAAIAVAALAGSTAAQSTWEYRLSGGTSTSGRLEARASSSAVWGTVCNDFFGSADATVACRSLRFSTVGASYSTATSAMRGSSSQPIVMDNLLCSGSEVTLDACSFSTVHNCGHVEDIVLSCPNGNATSTAPIATTTTGSATATTSYTYRLTGGDGSTWGRLEVRPTSPSTASWGVVCDDLFGLSDARVACRSLGLSTTSVGYRTVLTAERPISTMPFHMDDLQCSGTEANLGACTQSSTENCGSYEAIMISCSSTSVPYTAATPAATPATTPAATRNFAYRLTGGSATHGRLEVQPAPGQAWGTVCDDYFGLSDARVACRSLGFATDSVGYRTVTTSEQGSSTQPTWMDDLSCTGTEANLGACSQSSTENCWSGEAVALSCGSTSVAFFGSGSAPSTGSGTVDATGDWDYRLAGGDGRTYGRVEVRTSRTGAWGTVCDDFFGSADARVVCNALNQSTLYTAYRTATSGERGSYTQAIVMDDLQCIGNERYPHHCARASRHNCVHSEDVVVACGRSSVPSFGTGSSTTITIGGSGLAPPPPPAGNYEYRLAGGSATHGRLEVRAEGTTAWSTVCDDWFGFSDARVACRSLNFTADSLTVGYRTARTGEQGADAQAIDFDDLDCAGGEPFLHECQRTTTHNCRHYEDVVLSCGASVVPAVDTPTFATPAVLGNSTAAAAARASAPVATWQYRLVDGADAQSGRLEVRPPGQFTYGLVCDDYFGTLDLAVACRALGYSSYSSYRTVRTAERGSTSQPTYMDDVRCAGTESRLEECSFTTRHNCGTWEAVYLTCAGTYNATIATTVSGTAPTSENVGTAWSYRLVGGVAPNTGRLEVMTPSTLSTTASGVIGPVGEWGTVCDDSFGRADAVVACRALGMDTTNVNYRTARYSLRGSSSQSILMDDLRCTGQEARPDQCPRQSYRHNCYHGEDVELTCGRLPVPVRSRIRLGGSGWAGILNSGNSTRVDELRAALIFDLMTLLALAFASLIRINSLSVGSLVIDFEVNATSASEAAAVATAINGTSNASAGNSAALFSSVKQVYATETPEGRAGEVVSVSNAEAVPQELESEEEAAAGIAPDAVKASPGAADSSSTAANVVAVVAATAAAVVAALVAV